jgi:hypothetical protein
MGETLTAAAAVIVALVEIIRLARNWNKRE